MNSLSKLLIDESITGFLRSKYHKLTREILISNWGTSTIKCLNVNNTLYYDILRDCNNITTLKTNGKSSKMAEYKLNQDYGLIYENILCLGNCVKLNEKVILSHISKRTNDEHEIFENGLSMLPFLKLPFHIIIIRHEKQKERDISKEE